MPHVTFNTNVSNCQSSTTYLYTNGCASGAMVFVLFCHANQFYGVHSPSCYWRTIWDKLTFMPTARLIWLFTHVTPFVPTDNASKINWRKKQWKIHSKTYRKTAKNKYFTFWALSPFCWYRLVNGIFSFFFSFQL